MERVLLLGGSGILGSEVLQILQNESINYVAPKSSDLDIRNRTQLINFVKAFKPTWIINCAAWTDVDAAENSFEQACELNELAVESIGIAAVHENCKVVHISTDYVLDGESETPYEEFAAVNPKNKYGESKLRGENALLRVLSGAYVVRTSWLYGVSGKNFVKTITGKAMRNELAKVVDDQVGSPTSARDLAMGVASLMKIQPEPGIYNFSNEGRCSWFELAQTIYEFVGADSKLVDSIESRSLNKTAPRPKYSLLDKNKWRNAELSPVPDWRSSLEIMLPEIITNLKKSGEK